MKISGIWHITKMSQWGNDFVNAEEQAYIRIEKNGQGALKFGYVTVSIDGEFEESSNNDEKFYFSFIGTDDSNETSGMGWLKLTDKNKLAGKIRFHDGDSSMLSAVKKSGK